MSIFILPYQSVTHHLIRILPSRRKEEVIYKNHLTNSHSCNPPSGRLHFLVALKIVATMSLGPQGSSLDPEQAENFEDVSHEGELNRLC